MGESLLEPLPDSQLADVVPGVQQARDVCESTANKAQDLQRSSNFNAMQQCTTVSPTATDSSPFVVLMGWVNCSDKYLKKYSDLLAGLGFSSVRTIQPTFQAFSLYESPRRVWASNILDFLIAQQAPSRPVVLWCFSNGGCWVLEQMILLLEQERYQAVKAALAGLIFDSCPCWMSPKTGTLSLTEGTNFPMKQLITVGLALYFFLTRLLNRKGAQRFWNRMMDEAVPVPRLYFYSSSDKLCEVQHLEPLLAQKQKQGLDMTVKKFDDSPHCSHLRKHPQEYTFELQAFLKKLSR